MKFSTKMLLISYLPNIPPSIIYIYLSHAFIYDFPFSHVICAMIITFTLIAVLIKIIAKPIDLIVSKYEKSNILTKNAEMKVKSIHSLLSNIIPKLFILLIIISYYTVVSMVDGGGLLSIFNIGSLSDFGHIIALFTTSFITLGIIFDNQLGHIRARLKITSIEGDRLYRIKTRMLILTISMLMAIGLSITYYYEAMAIRIFTGNRALTELFQVNNSKNIDDKVSLLDTFLSREIDFYNVIKSDFENKLESLDTISNRNDLTELEQLYTDMNPFISEEEYFMELRNKIKGDQIFISLLLLMFTLYSIGVVLILSNNITNQMKLICSKIDTMLRRERVTYDKLPIISRTEVSHLTGEFNRLLKRLNNQNSELQGFYNDMEKKVLEKTQELQHSNRINAGISALSPGLYRKKGIIGITEHTLEQLNSIFGPNYKFAVHLKGTDSYHFSGYSKDEELSIIKYIENWEMKNKQETGDTILPDNSLILPILTSEREDHSGVMIINSESEDPVDITTQIFLEQIANFIEIDSLHRKLKKMANTDPLTGVHNRGYFEKKIKEIVQTKYSDSGSNFSFMYGDINRLKYVNDNIGHLAGDELIKSAVKFFKNLDGITERYIFRLGGDEIAMIYKNSSIGFDQSIMKELENLLEKYKVDLNEDQEISLHISIGIVNTKELSVTDYTPEEFENQLFKEAEHRMEENKRKWYQENKFDRRS